MIFSVFTDGGARGNPGPAAVGVVIKDEKGKVVHQFGQAIGKTTNNVAEYRAVISALEWLGTRHQQNIVNFYLDSALVVHQIRGDWKIKEAHLKELVSQVHRLEGRRAISYTAIPREQNSLADALVNRALDGAKIG